MDTHRHLIRLFAILAAFVADWIVATMVIAAVAWALSTSATSIPRFRDAALAAVFIMSRAAWKKTGSWIVMPKNRRRKQRLRSVLRAKILVEWNIESET